MGQKSVEVEGCHLAGTITPPASSTSLELMGYGYTGMSIETVEIRFTAIGVYMASTICEHLQKWKGKPAAELLEEESGFHKDLMEAPAEKVVKISVIKGVKGLPYGSALQSSMRDRLVNDDKYEEAEEAALEELVAFFQPHNLPKGSTIIYHWPTPSSVKISLSPDDSVPEKVAYTIEDPNVSQVLLDLYLGESSLTETTTASVVEHIASQLA